MSHLSFINLLQRSMLLRRLLGETFQIIDILALSAVKFE